MANQLPGNPHVQYLHDAGDIPHETALVTAVLALSFEQRTANLIAYMENNPSALVLDGIDLTVRARLGLKEDPNA